MFKKLFIIFIFTLTSSFAEEDLISILGEIEQQSDLSKLTKKESIGHVSVFTRSEIDKLRLTTLKELLQYIRFSSYTENYNGLPYPIFFPHERINDDAVKIYIDDQALLFPYQGNGVQFFGQISLNFIDHIEIYWGIPSFSFSVKAGYTIIKLYTKNPSYENTTVLNTYAKTYGSKGINGYSSYAFKDFSYLLSVVKENNKRKTLYRYDGYPLKRDSYNNFVYTQFSTKNLKFTFNGMKNKYNSFIGDSLEAKVTDNHINLRYLYFGLNYHSNDDSTKAYIGYADSNTKLHQEANPIGYLTEDYYYKQNDELTERLLNAKLSHQFTFKDDILEIGFKGSYKNFSRDRFDIDEKHYNINTSYDKETTASIYAENSYFITPSNMLVSSFQYDRYIRNGNAKNNNGISLKFGYIYNGENLYTKLYAYYGQPPRMYYQFYNYIYYGNVNEENSKENSLAFSTEVGLHVNRYDIGLTYGHIIADKRLFKEKIKTDLASLIFKYKFNQSNNIHASLWTTRSDLGEYTIPKVPTHIRQNGAYIILTNRYDSFDFANTLTYHKNNTDNESYYNLNSTIIYHFSRNLEFYIKGTNLLNKAIEYEYNLTNYYTKDRKYSSYTAPLYDKTVMVGLEYSFWKSYSFCLVFLFFYLLI